VACSDNIRPHRHLGGDVDLQAHFVALDVGWPRGPGNRQCRRGNAVDQQVADLKMIDKHGIGEGITWVEGVFEALIDQR
jgi:hypothetical protein